MVCHGSCCSSPVGTCISPGQRRTCCSQVTDNLIIDLRNRCTWKFILRVRWNFGDQRDGTKLLITEVPSNPQYEFPRTPVAQVYNQIISDLRTAGPSLPWRYTSADRGRATRAMAYHFLAKAYLTRASATTEQRGQKPTDLDSVIVFADSVIKNSGHVMEPDFGNLFNAGYPDGRIAPLGENGAPPTGSKTKIDQNNASNEIIFAAQFSSNL